MRVLIACESSGVSRDAFRELGHQAYSCDLLPADEGTDPTYHYQCDVREILSENWDLLIAHPSCTYLSGSGWHWVTRGRIEADGRPRIEHVEEALAFAKIFIGGKETEHIPKVVAENPIGKLSTLIRKPDQIIQPYQFGEDASKATCLWIKGLPKLVPTLYVPPRLVEWNGKTVRRWANQTDSGQNVLPPSDDRWKIRSKTYLGIADAFAHQWGNPAQKSLLEMAA